MHTHFLIELFDFFFTLNCMRCLYILEISQPLSVTSFANIFFHSISCLFILSFPLQNLLSSIGSHLFIFAFISVTLGGRLKKIFLQFMYLCHRVFCLCFSLRVLEYLVFTCFNAVLPNLPTLSLSHRVHKTVPYISVSFAVSCKISCMKRDASPGSMHNTGCLGLVHWDDLGKWH